MTSDYINLLVNYFFALVANLIFEQPIEVAPYDNRSRGTEYFDEGLFVNLIRIENAYEPVVILLNFSQVPFSASADTVFSAQNSQPTALGKRCGFESEPKATQVFRATLFSGIHGAMSHG
ncbi:hypothetical protein D3C75_988980 [compost metagenome]